MSVFESIVKGLNEATEYEKGNGKARFMSCTVTPAPTFSADEIKALRKELNMTQSTFAAVMGVSCKTVEAWEAGTNISRGTARRMLGMLKTDTTILQKYNIVR